MTTPPDERASVEPPRVETTPPADSPPIAPTWGGLLRWSATMLAVSLLVAAISIPLLRLLGFG